jgi:hypothetical protein
MPPDFCIPAAALLLMRQTSTLDPTSSFENKQIRNVVPSKLKTNWPRLAMTAATVTEKVTSFRL